MSLPASHSTSFSSLEQFASEAIRSIVFMDSHTRKQGGWVIERMCAACVLDELFQTFSRITLGGHCFLHRPPTTTYPQVRPRSLRTSGSALPAVTSFPFSSTLRIYTRTKCAHWFRVVGLCVCVVRIPILMLLFVSVWRGQVGVYDFLILFL